MTEILPLFTKLDVPEFYDNSLERIESTEIPCSKTGVSINQSDSQLLFNYQGDFLYRLSSPNTGFYVKYAFRTRDAANNNRNSQITLSSNFFGYLFKRAVLKLGGTHVEEIDNLGICMDTLYHCEESEFRNHTGESLGFIPDTSDNVSDSIGNRTGDFAGADVAAIIASGNNADNRVVQINNNFNKGFVRRKKLYNYTVAANDNFREGEIFIPLNRIFGFCSEVDKVLKYVPFEIELVRNSTYTPCFYGAANTGMQFGNEAESGIKSITLLLERVTLKPDLMINLEKQLSKPFEISYLRRICEEHRQIHTDRTATYLKSFNSKEQGFARYLFCIFKTDADNTAQNNFQRCGHCNMQNISVSYAGNTYPSLPQNQDWSNNQFAKFYKDYLQVARAL